MAKKSVAQNHEQCCRGAFYEAVRGLGRRWFFPLESFKHVIDKRRSTTLQTNKTPIQLRHFTAPQLAWLVGRGEKSDTWQLSWNLTALLLQFDWFWFVSAIDSQEGGPVFELDIWLYPSLLWFARNDDFFSTNKHHFLSPFVFYFALRVMWRVTSCDCVNKK